MAGFNIFLKLDSIDGESTTKGHEKEIEVISYDQSIDSTIPTGGGAGAALDGDECSAGQGDGISSVRRPIEVRTILQMRAG
jgi:hypothetical protein